MRPCWSGEITVPIEPRQGRREWVPPPASPAASGLTVIHRTLGWQLGRQSDRGRKDPGIRTSSRAHQLQGNPESEPRGAASPQAGHLQSLSGIFSRSLASPTPNLPGRSRSHRRSTVDETGAQRAEEAHPDGWKLGGGVLTKPQLSDLQNGDRDARLSGL